MTDLLSELEAVAAQDEAGATDRELGALTLAIYRTHHAEIAAAVRKADRYDWLRAMGETEAEIMFRAQMYAGTPPDLMDEAIDEQMHNSAREGKA